MEPLNTPGQRAVVSKAPQPVHNQSRTECHCTNLLSVLRTYLNKSGLCMLRSTKRLRELSTLAKDKPQWTKRGGGPIAAVRSLLQIQEPDNIIIPSCGVVVLL